MTDLTLYSMPSSGNSYKVRLLLAFLGHAYRHIALEYETPELAAAQTANTLPLGKLPVLELADGTHLPESNAILCYLANGTLWMPGDPVVQAQALAWMFWEQNQHEGVIAVRAALRTYANRKHLATPDRMADLLTRGHDLLAQMDAHLADRAWLAGKAPSIADIALYAYTHSAGQKGGFEMDRFPAVLAWLDRLSSLPGYVSLDETPA